MRKWWKIFLRRKKAQASPEAGRIGKNMSAHTSIMIKRVSIAIITFIVTAVLLAGLLVSTAFIPKESLRDNMLESAEYLYEGELFGYRIGKMSSTRIDRYADAILLNIAWHYDSEEPLRSVMKSSYYFTPYLEENENFLNSVKDDLPANYQYLRYWHGSILPVRLLLLIMPIKGIYILNACLMVLLTAGLFLMLALKKAYTPIKGLAAAFVLTSVWFVPLSLEYTWVFLIALIACIAVTAIYSGARKAEPFECGIFFMVTGMITNYFDFLTAETLTLLLPLILLLWFNRDRIVKTALFSVGGWGIGYVLMWVLKWIITSIVFGENAIPYVTEHIAERLGGDVGLKPGQYQLGAIIRNISCLLPIDLGVAGAVAAAVVLLVFGYISFVYRKEKFEGKRVLVFLLLGLVPFVRFVVLHNHSYIHFFFAYRALASTVFALVLIYDEIVDKGFLAGEKIPGKADRNGKRRK